MSKFLPYGRQNIDDDDIAAVSETLKADFITQGPVVSRFEEALAAYCGRKYAVVLSSGTAALHGAYLAAGIGPGDEVVTSPITFAATSNAALFLGARPVFTDVEPDTGNMDPRSLEVAITGKTKLVVPVHYAGHPADMNRIMSIARARGSMVIEDACHALGASYRDRKAGSIADMSVFSFHPVKPITSGEGGAVLTDNEEHYKKIMAFRIHGIVTDLARLRHEPPGPWYYEMQFLGYNYRLTDIQASLGLSQLKKLDSFIARRREIASRYAQAFAGNPWFDIPVERKDVLSGWHLYPIRLRDGFAERKAEIMKALLAGGVGTQVHYIPVYLHPAYEEIGYAKGLCPRAEEFYARSLSIPMFPRMIDEEVSQCIETVIRVMTELERG